MKIKKEDILSWIQTLDGLFTFKYIKDQICEESCVHKIHRGWECTQCKKINRRVSSMYHILPKGKGNKDLAADELALRIAYELLFDILSIEDIITGDWSGSGKRNVSHQIRILSLIDCVNTPDYQTKYVWLEKGFPPLH